MAVNPKKDALTSSDLAGAIPEDFVGAVNKNAKFAPGDVAYCRTFACNARVMSVGTTKSGICNYKVALYDAKGVRTGEAVCSESDLVRRSVRGLKLTGLASGASRACDVAATILEKMVQRNKVDLPLAKKMLRLTQRDFPDARVSVAAAKLNENPPALLSAAKILRAEANRLRAQGKSMKAMRAAVKRAPAEALPMIAPLHSKLLMIYRKFIGSPETASLGSLPALAAQWKAVGNKLPDEEQSGVALIVRDLISAYRSFTKEQTKNVAYFLAMALGTANKMVGGGANVPIPAHLRSVKAFTAAEEALIKRGMSNVQKGDLDLRDAERERDGYIRHSAEIAKQSKRATDPQRADELMKQSDTLLRRAAIAHEVIQRLKRQGMGYKPLRSVKGEVTRKVVLNNARKRFLDNYKFKVADAEYEKPNPAWQGGKRLPTLLSAADVTSKVNEYIFANSGARYGKLIAMDMNAYASFITKIAANQGSALGIHHLFGDKPGGFANADTIVRIGANAWNEYSTKFNASIQNKPAN